jgi:uncharacterized repeat protein (TIGR03803 family)
MTNRMRSVDWISRLMQSASRTLASVAVLALAFFTALPLRAQTFSVLYEFKGGTDGESPQAGLVRDAAGNFYGTTPFGGKLVQDCSYAGPGCGTVFKIDPNGNETVLYRFAGAPDGVEPMAGLILDNDGNLYGTTSYGGASNYGAVFKVDSSGQETILYSFGAYPDGEFPSGGLVMDADGNLYGTTQEGGTNDSCWGNCGAVFKLDTNGKETVLLNFTPPAESPTAALTLDAAGNLYGTTLGNGYCCVGTVFKLSKDIAVRAQTLYTFLGGPDGESPFGGVIRDAKGGLYGMAFRGGDFNCTYSHGYGCGVVYELSRDGKETVLHSFAGPPDGALPTAGLLRDKAGSLYGTSSFGGSSGFGTVFKLGKQGKMTVLHNFVNTDGATPYSTLTRDAAGNLYGTTVYGGDFTCNPQYGCGVVFKITR